MQWKCNDYNELNGIPIYNIGTFGTNTVDNHSLMWII